MDLLLIYLKRLVYGLLLLAVIFLLQDKFTQLQMHWLVLTIFFLSFLSALTLFGRIRMLVVTGLVAAIAVYSIVFLVPYLPLLIIVFFLLTVGGVYLRQVKSDWLLPVVLTGTLIILSVETIVTPWENLTRFAAMCMGVAILVIAQCLFFSHQSVLLYQRNALRSLKKLNSAIFSCLLEQEYLDNIYLYERRLHIQKLAYMHSMQAWQTDTVRPEERTQCASRRALDSLFNNMMDYAQLRRRVKDYTTLSICSQELKSIHLAMNHLFDGIIGRDTTEKIAQQYQILHHKISNLEDNYHHVLQVASNEPLVFLLFINSLQGFAHRMAALGGLTMDEVHHDAG